MGDSDRYVVSVLGPAAAEHHVQAVSNAISQCGAQLESFEPREKSVCPCIELRVNATASVFACLRASFLALAQELGVDLAIQKESQYGWRRRLIAFDMDSTLIQAEIIDELAKMKGVGDEVSRVTEAAMRGELDFQQSFTRRLSLLRGLPEARVLELLDRVPLTDGAEVLISTLKRHGYKTAILSGGFVFFGRRLQARLGIDYLYANELEVVNGLVTGEVVPPIMDGQRKAAMFQEIARREGIPLEETVAVGDGANDLPMINLAGMGIAFRAKPVVRQSAQYAISYSGLDAILDLLGIGRGE